MAAQVDPKTSVQKNALRPMGETSRYGMVRSGEGNPEKAEFYSSDAEVDGAGLLGLALDLRRSLSDLRGESLIFD